MNSLLVAIRENSWYDEIRSFRNDARSYLVKRKVAEDEFLLDILQVLFEDDVMEQCKIELLNTLQESSFMFKAVSSVENTIGSLQNLYSQVMSDKHTAAHGLLPGQILNTMVAVLLMHADDMEMGSAYCGLYVQVIELLWMQCSKVNQTSKFLVRHSAIQGLIAIEEAFPGILSIRLEELQKFCSQEKTFLLQSYAALLSLALKHANSSEGDRKNCTLLKKLMKVDSSSSPVDPVLAKRLFNYIIDLFPFMSPVIVNYSLQKLVNIIMQLNDVSPLVFKPIYVRYLGTSDIVAFSTALFLQKKFESLVSSKAETQQLVSQLLIQANHPSLKIAQRLLLLSWCLENIDMITQFSSDQLHQHFLCNGFDGAETQHLNHKLLAETLTPGPHPNEMSEILISSLDLFRKKICYGCPSKIVISCFQSLYCYYVKFSNTVIRPEIQKILLSLMADKPILAQNVLNFLQAVKRFDSESSLPLELLSALVNNISKLSVRDIDSEDLLHHLLILEFAAKESLDAAQPSLIINFLNKLLVETCIAETGGWLLGNEILAVLRSILYYQDTDQVYQELGDLLHKISGTFTSDTDVRDQAKLYYCMLTSISSSKLSRMMQGMIQSNDNMLSLDDLVADGSGLRMGVPVLHLDSPVITIKKIPTKQSDFIHEVIECDSNSFNSESDVLKAYENNLNSSEFQSEIRIEFSVEINGNSSTDFDKLIGLVLHFDIPESFGSVNDIEWPALTKSSGPLYSQITLKPSRSYPVQIRIRETFNQQNGQTCSTYFSYLTIDFEDFFKPLKVPAGIKNPSEWKLSVFKEMENKFLAKAKLGRDSSYQKCIMRLQLSADELVNLVLPSFHDCMIPSSNANIYNAAVFVPPAGYLLFTFEPADKLEDEEQSVLVHVVTNSSQLYLYVDDMFQRMISSRNS